MASHRLTLYDIEADTGREAVIALGIPDVVYCDPPWSESNLKWWRTYYKQPADVSYVKFLGNFAAIVCRARHDVFVEISTRSYALLDEKMQEYGGHLMNKWIGSYGNPKKPFFLTRWLFGPPYADWSGPDLTQLGGTTMVRYALKSVVRPRYVVLDPCIGHGMTARIAIELGCVVWGNDLVQSRLDKCQELLDGLS